MLCIEGIGLGAQLLRRVDGKNLEWFAAWECLTHGFRPQKSARSGLLGACARLCDWLSTAYRGATPVTLSMATHGRSSCGSFRLTETAWHPAHCTKRACTKATVMQ